MTGSQLVLQVLVIDDDREYLDLLTSGLPSNVGGYEVTWVFCDTFEQGERLLKLTRYDLVLCDAYRGGPERDDAKALDIIGLLRASRFCLILVFTAHSRPASLTTGPFIGYVDKAAGDEALLDGIQALLSTGIPALARRLHDELDSTAGSYLWGFLEQHWSALVENGLSEPAVLERLVRRRAAVQLGRLSPTAQEPMELGTIEGVEFYLRPPISGEDFRLGEILRGRENGEFRVLLTPHCHLAKQPGQELPRAEYVLTVRTALAKDLFRELPVRRTSETKVLAELGRRVQSPARIEKTEGRYWFLPGFLDMPDLYCDFLQLESLPYRTLETEFERAAVLDAPFAEALQSCFLRFYAAVGLPALNVDRFRHLAE